MKKVAEAMLQFTQMNMGARRASLCAVFLCHFALLQLQFSVSQGYDEACDSNSLEGCHVNEVCSLLPNNSGICRCLEGYIPSPYDKTCIANNPDPPPEENSSGVTVGVVVTLFLILLIGLVGFLHYRFRILNGVIHSIYRIRRRPSRGQAYEVADDVDDVNPIV